MHGWPERDGRPSDSHDLVSRATLAVRNGEPDGKGWPLVDDVQYSEHAFTNAVPHPFDDGVLLGTHVTVDHGADAVVSMCRVGRRQACFGEATEFVASRLMDSADPAENPNLEFVLADTADAVRGLRAEGKTVLLHCVAGHQRTPSVAVEYGVMLGHSIETVRAAVLEAMPGARGYGIVWESAGAATQRRYR
ncbi:MULTISPECIES: hypothetical protein [Gordonia]|uniref:hypothetical protein n=1 Tax=Gordonia TaxID=2053 RepID=UPI000A5773EA